jgi:hypothetical protein
VRLHGKWPNDELPMSWRGKFNTLARLLALLPKINFFLSSFNLLFSRLNTRLAQSVRRESANY